jgi:hypothetical protein
MLHSSQLLGANDLRNLLQVITARAALSCKGRHTAQQLLLSACHPDRTCCQYQQNHKELPVRVLKTQIIVVVQVADAVTAMLLGPDICTSGHAAMKRHLKGQAGS